jgi:ectoine hydroxylase-related dioxygenase (phytanoyl-CoA dioxygenase family)
MDTACLEHRLTAGERRQFEEQGYLIVEDALPEDWRRALIAAVDRVDTEERRRHGYGSHHQLLLEGFIERDPAFLELLDWPRTFPKVWGLLGWNIYAYHTHLGVNPPVAPDQPRETRRLHWHQDSGRVNLDIATHPRPRLSLKVAYFLTDMREPGQGNFSIIPGSHLHDTLAQPADRVSDPPGAMPVCVGPGTAVFFDRRLWHSASPNWSDRTRKVLFYGYAYRWLQPVVHLTWPTEVLEACSPIRRQLLGASARRVNSSYFPGDADVPLRGWLREHQPDDSA